jgi:hypothetical protein
MSGNLVQALNQTKSLARIAFAIVSNQRNLIIKTVENRNGPAFNL